ncbi:MAG TPA: hypothetical protein VI277_09360 [Candidatus Limnocylindria bacterium]
MNPFEIALVGALGIGCIALITAAAVQARRRRSAAAALEDEPRSSRRAPVSFEEDPIVAALGLGADVAEGHQARTDATRR